MERALAIAGPDDLVCATGSIYLIGRLRNLLFPEAELLADAGSGTWAASIS